jgi:hypothetical protein
MRKTSGFLLLAYGAVLAQTAPYVSSFPTLGMGSPTPVTSSKDLEIHQSYSLSYASGGGASMSQGTYLTQMSYRLSDPLTLKVDAGLATPLHSTGMNGTDMQGSQFILPRVGLEYRPSESTILSVNYCRMPTNALNYPGYGPWGASSWP